MNQNGPGNPAAMIAALQKPAQAKAPAPVAPTPQKPAVESAAEIAKKVGKLTADAKDAEKQGKLPDALNDYAAILKLQPGNQDAQSATDRIEQVIKSDPAAARNELVSAIRSFYHSQYDDARRSLLDYLESPQTASNPGVADFYLGATLIERSMFASPRAQWQGPSQEALTAFKKARAANYNPARQYVSPYFVEGLGCDEPVSFGFFSAQVPSQSGCVRVPRQVLSFRIDDFRARSIPIEEEGLCHFRCAWAQ